MPGPDAAKPAKPPRSWVLAAAAGGIFVLGGLAQYAFHRGAAPTVAITPAPAAGDRPAGPAKAAAPTVVETARAIAQDVALDANAVGSLRANESVVLRPEAAGKIAAIHFRDGATVARGALLVSLDAAVQQAELDQAKANLGLAQTTQRRNQELFEKRFISRQALDAADAALKVQEASVALAQAKYEQTRIRAPFAGIVGIRKLSVGDFVKDGQDLINLEDISRLKVDFRLPDAYLGQLRRGQRLELASDALPGQRFQATLDAVDPLIEAGGRSLSCRGVLDNREGRLRPGLFARVRLELGRRDGVLLIPEEAIVADAKAPFVFRVVDGRALRTPVATGLRRDAQVEIVSGLAAGDVVVTAGQQKLRDGAAVRAPAAAAPTAEAAAPKAGKAGE